MRRQDEGTVCQLNGAIYVNYWRDVALDLKQSYNPYAYVMDADLSIDIDTLDDWEHAEMKFRMLKGIGELKFGS